MQTEGLQELNRGGSAYTSLHSNVFGKADAINLPNCTYLNVAQQNFPIPFAELVAACHYLAGDKVRPDHEER